MATYNLFISHSWAYSDTYANVCSLLDKQVGTNGFNYKNYSVPKDDPIHNADNDKQLRAAIENQMRPASSILILAGVYATYSKWINIEIEIAQALGKKIIAVQPWGAERTSAVVKKAATNIVGWNGSSIVKAICE
ncbi:TIR domain-containing protein [Aeromonas enteropelogenes]|uniref:TIR domain-containing protein n=1 Tax=Aeromonas enteropelogenes TaxID=29489 RepID=UPI0038D01C4D